MSDISLTSPASPNELVVAVFNAAWDQAQAKSDASDDLFNNAINPAIVGATPQAEQTGFSFTPNVVEPLVDIPTTAEAASLATFYELSTATINQLADLFRAYMNEYFPDATYLTSAQEWIINAIENGGTGVNTVVESAIWQRDRDRIMAEFARQEEELRRTWAARRYPLPPGALTHQVSVLRQEAANKVADASRAVAIDVWKTEIETTKFAVEKAISLYGAAVGAAMEYVKALSVGPASGMQLIPSITDSQSKLIGAASEYYRARISVEELRLKGALPAAEMEQQTRLKNAEMELSTLRNKVDAAIAAAQSMGTQAASALNALHASAGVSGGSSTSVGYQYRGDVDSDVPPLLAS